jgi:membrane fusion protein (multidrug efflux system)
MVKSYVRDVRVQEAVIGDVERVVSRVSTVEAPNEVRVIPQVSGQLEELLVEEGSSVRKGQLIARIDDTTQQLAVERAQSIYEKGQYDYNLLKRQFEADVVGAEQVAQAEFQMKQAERDLEQARVELEKTRLKAPISGVVSARSVTAGDMVFSNAPVVTIVDTTNLEASVMVPQTQVEEISVGNQVQMVPGSDESRTISGTVKRISPVIDVATGSVKITVGLNNTAGTIKPGTFVRVKIITGILEDVVLIPRDAVVIENAMSVVYKVEEGVAYRIPVDVGFSKNGFVQVLGTLDRGDSVVVSGHTGLDDMMKVNVLEGDLRPRPEADALVD